MIEGIMEVGSSISFPALVVPQLGSLTGVQHPPWHHKGLLHIYIMILHWLLLGGCVLGCQKNVANVETMLR